jgi:hypothetical protein
MSEGPTRADANLMALRFLRDNGPHTLGPIEDEGSLAAAMILLDLTKAGLTAKQDFGKGYLQFSLTSAGRRLAEAA